MARQRTVIPTRGSAPKLLVAAGGIVLSAALLLLAVRRAHLSDVWNTLGDARPAYLLLAVSSLALMYVLQARRWAFLLGLGGRVRQWSVLTWVVGGIAVNNVVPARAGDVARVHWAARGARVGYARALATVAVDRTADVFVLAVGLLVGLIAVGAAGWPVVLTLAALGLVSAVVAAALTGRFGLLRLGRTARFGRWISSRAGTSAVRAVDAFLACLRPSVLGRVVLLSILGWGAWTVAAFAVAHALGFDLDVAELVFLAGAVNLGVAVPSSPGFVGTYQWLCVAALGVVGVDASAALAFSILLHAAWFVPTTLAGAALLVAKTSFGRSATTPLAAEDAS